MVRCGGDDADWRRSATVVLLRRVDDEMCLVFVFVWGCGDVWGVDVVLLLVKCLCIFDDVEGVEFKVVALASFVSY